jgi:hypothetical protein
VVFFLLSILLSNYFASELDAAAEEEHFEDKDYKKLFEFTDPYTQL